MARGRLVLLLLALIPGRAFAQTTSADDLARAHFESASAYYEQARYEDAAREFLESYRLSPRAALLENAARAYERALLFDDAISTLRRLMETHPDFQPPAVTEERIRNLERLKQRAAGGGGGGGGGGGSPSTGPARPGQPPPSGGGGISIPGIVLVAGGGALLLGSVIMGGVSHSMYETLSAECVDGVCPAERQGDIDTGNALAITSTVFLFTGVAAAAVGVVLLALNIGGESARAELRTGPGEAGLSMRVRF